MANWDELPEELVIEIGERVGRYDDFESVAEVSSHWKSSLRSTSYCGRSPQVPWLMLPAVEDENIDKASTTSLRFYSLSKRMIHHQCTMPMKINDVRCYSSNGWLLMVSRYLSMSLYNPFSGRQIPLPDKTSLGDHDVFDDTNDDDDDCKDMFAQFVQKCALSSSPSSGIDDFSVMIIYGKFSRLAIWSVGDNAWTRVEAAGHMFKGAFLDITCFQGDFYAVDCECRVLAVACTRSKPGMGEITKTPIKANVVVDVSRFCPEFVIPYLVESGNKLLVVPRSFANEDSLKFSVLEVNVSNGEAQEVNDLGNMALFLGDNHSMSIEASTRNGCKANCIYLADDSVHCRLECFKEEKRFAIYNLSDSSVEHCYAGEMCSRFTSSLWIEPRH
ncbi:hypothetical protein Droror1_Dr00025396 [Drosera rotundifolia]